MNRNIISERSDPVFAKETNNYQGNYHKGYIGFTRNDKNIISKGIAYFTRRARMSDIKVTHALIVSDENECVEAHLKTGVQRRNLSDYFDNEHCQIFFRKPKGYNENIGKRIVDVAKSQVGCQYDPKLIKHLLTAYSSVGWMINKITEGEFERCITSDHEGDSKWICSELAAYCLNQQEEYKGKGILSKPNSTIDPQELFEDRVIFEPWHNYENTL